MVTQQQNPAPRNGFWVTGTARDFEKRHERSAVTVNNFNAGTEIWNFRVERHDAYGNRLPPVPVEMQAWRFSGTVNNGDEVRVGGRVWNGRWYVDAVENFTTQRVVRPVPFVDSRDLLTVLAVLGGVFVIIAVVLIGVWVNNS